MWYFDSTAFTFDNNTTSYTFDGGAPGLYAAPAATSGLYGQLTNWTTVTLQSPLVGGIGSALDPYLWTTPSPGIGPSNVGTTLYYDGTNMTIAQDGTITASSNNFSAVIQFYSPAGVLGYAVYTVEPGIVTYMQASSGAYGSLGGNTAQISQAAYGLASLANTITAQIALAQGANATAYLQNALTAAIQLAEQAGALASLTAPLSTTVKLADQAGAIASLANQLTTQIPLLLSETARAALTGPLSTAARFQQPAAALANATAALTNGPRFAETAAAIANLANQLTTQIPIALGMTGRAALTNQIIVPKPLAMNPAAIAASQSTMRVGAGFRAVAGAVASSQSSLINGIRLSTLAASVASFQHNLLTVQVLNVPVLLSHQVPGVYQPGEIPEGQFPLPVGQESYYGIDWTYWICYRWQPGYSASLGYVVRPFPWTGFEYICTQAGQTGSYQPAWTTLISEIVVDGDAQWTCQAISTASLLDTVTSASWSAPAGITVTAYAAVNNFTPVLVNATAATANTTYLVTCTATLASGEFLIGKLYMDVY